MSNVEPMAGAAGIADAPWRYRAFISYSHRDRKAAEWLHKAIENYRIPKDLVGTQGRDGPIPKTLFPLFRDRDELSASPQLSASIEAALAQSACLIVLCSPSSAVSRWVGQEIVEFRRLGRGNRIFALIVDGDPAAAPGEGGCFPPALHAAIGPDGELVADPTLESIAADMRPDADGRDDAKLKLIAGLIGVAFNALRRREVAAARRRLRITQAIAGSMLALALAVGLAGWSAWYFRQESDERQIPGLRVPKRVTLLDLAGWQETTPQDLAERRKKSFAVATDRYTIIRTQPQARNYVHIVGTSSGIAPEVTCQACKVSARYADDASRAPNELKVEFDISGVKLEEPTEVEYTTKYWNAFQTPDQLWAGMRVLYQTESASFAVRFPPGKHPRPEQIRYVYHDNKDHPIEGEKNLAFELDGDGGVAMVTWLIAFPSTDRSYRMHWDWAAPATTRSE